MWVRSLGQEDLLEEGMATHSNILAWRIPWTDESGGLQSVGWQRVRCALMTEHRLRAQSCVSRHKISDVTRNMEKLR